MKKNKLISELTESLFLGDNRRFYSCLCRYRFGYSDKEVYIVRRLGNREFPYILTDDIRVILYSYIPYKFKKEDIKPDDIHYYGNTPDGL